MPPLEPLIWSVLVPALVAGGILLLGLRRGIAPDSWPEIWTLPAAIAAACVAGHAGAVGWPELPPLDAIDWTLWIAAGAAGLAVVEGALGLPAAVRWPCRVLASAAVPALLVWPLIRGMGVSGAAAFIAVAAAILAVWWIGLACLAPRDGRADVPILLWAAAAGSSLVLLGFGNAKLAGFAGTLAAALGAAAVWAWLRPRFRFPHPALAVPVLVLASLLISGRLYSSTELPLGAILALAAGPLAGFAVLRVLGRRALGRRSRPFLATAVALAVEAAVLGAAMFLVPPSTGDAGF